MQEFERTLDDRSCRFVAVHSTHLDARKKKTLERLVAQSMPPNQEHLHPFRTEVQEIREVKRGHRTVVRANSRRSRLSQDQYTAKEVLQEYKEQTAVEVRFRFLKDPFIADQLY